MRPGNSRPAWVSVADAVLDGAVVAFAVWTVLYEVATGLQLDAWATAVVWLPLGVACVAFCVYRAVVGRRGSQDGGRGRGRRRIGSRGGDDSRGGASAPTGERTGRARPRLAAAGCVLGATAAGLTLVVDQVSFLLLWAVMLLAALAVLVAVASGRGSVSWDRTYETAEPTGRTHLAAGLLVVALAGFMLFVLNPSADDIYYVNRSVWVAEHGTFSLRDTMFGPERYPATYGGGVPVASIEGLLGALAHLTGTSAASFTYLVAEPLLCLLAGWAGWRLVRRWAPRHALLVLAVAVAFSLMSATGTVGDFSYARMWQGKVLAICVLLPVAWTHLTALAEDRPGRERRRRVLMLLVSGLAFAGLTPTAVLMAPLVSGTAMLAALLLRRGRGSLVAGAAAFSAFPLLAGLAVVALSTGVGGASPRAQDQAGVFDRVLGEDPVVAALAVLGILLGPLVVRGPAARALAASASFATVAVLTPGVFELVNAVTGSGPILYRLLLLAPVPVLVGMLLAAPVPRGLPRPVRAALPGVLGVAAALALALGGTAAWSSDVGGRLTTRPVWKWPQAPLAEVRRVVELGPGPGPVLLPEAHMKTLPLMSTRTFAVNPRTYYLSGVQEPPLEQRQRRALTRLVSAPEDSLPRRGRVGRALEDLDVSLVCLDPQQRSRALDLVAAAGYREAPPAGDLTCLRAP